MAPNLFNEREGVYWRDLAQVEERECVPAITKLSIGEPCFTCSKPLHELHRRLIWALLRECPDSGIQWFGSSEEIARELCGGIRTQETPIHSVRYILPGGPEDRDEPFE